MNLSRWKAVCSTLSWTVYSIFMCTRLWITDTGMSRPWAYHAVSNKHNALDQKSNLYKFKKIPRYACMHCNFNGELRKLALVNWLWLQTKPRRTNLPSYYRVSPMEHRHSGWRCITVQTGSGVTWKHEEGVKWDLHLAYAVCRWPIHASQSTWNMGTRTAKETCSHHVGFTV